MTRDLPPLDIAEIDEEIRRGRQYLRTDLWFGALRLAMALAMTFGALALAPTGPGWLVGGMFIFAGFLAVLAVGHSVLCVGYLIGLRWYRRKRREAVAWKIRHETVREV